jgi:hypothetical protein
VSRSRQLSPLPDDLPLAVRTLLGELRLLKDRSGYDLRALATKTHFSRSSWGRWLSGETWIPREAVASMAELCAGDAAELNALWQRAEDERQARQFAAAAEANRDPALATATATATRGRRRTGGTGGTPATGTATAPAGEHAAPSGDLRAALRPAGGSRWSRPIFAVVVVACAVVAGAAGLAIGHSLRKTTTDDPAHPYTQWLTRQEILARVRMWHPHTAQRIPYSQTAFCQGYRTDGSGYASMALGLPAPGPLSTNLVSGQYTRRISPGDLLPGDLIINPSGDAGTRQVAVFDAWANATHRRYWVYQQRRGYGTDHLVLSYALDGRSAYHAYRPLNIHETGALRPTGTTP